MWKADLPLQESKDIKRGLRTIIHTCRNSAVKHLKDMERLLWRTNKTLNDLKQLAKELVEEGLTTAAKFIRNSVDCMIIFP